MSGSLSRVSKSAEVIQPYVTIPRIVPITAITIILYTIIELLRYYYNCVGFTIIYFYIFIVYPRDSATATLLQELYYYYYYYYYLSVTIWTQITPEI